MEKTYKLGEAAKYIGRHPKTLEKYDKKGILKAYRTKTNRRYYTQSQLDNYLNQQPKYEKATEDRSLRSCIFQSSKRQFKKSNVFY